MASDMSLYLGNKIVRWLDGNAFPTALTEFYVALFNGDPKASGTEVTTTIRAAGRLGATSVFSAPAAGNTNTMSNSADIDFGAAAGAATVTHVAIYDASTSGNLLFSKSVGSNSISAGQDVKFATGDLAFTLGS